MSGAFPIVPSAFPSPASYPGPATITAGTGGLAARDVYTIGADTLAVAAIATSYAVGNEFGLSAAALLVTESGQGITKYGAMVDGFTGLVPGAEYFLSDVTAGKLVAANAVPTAAGTTVIRIIKAVTATLAMFCPRVVTEVTPQPN